MVSRALLSSKSDEWFTPSSILERVAELDPHGRIALDPCWHPDCLVRAEVTRSAARGENGLEYDWRALVGVERLVFVNPPYSDISSWMLECKRHGARGGNLAALVPARTDTRWFHDHALSAPWVCFIKGRLKFANASARYSAPFPSAIFYWGALGGLFRARFDAIGWTVETDAIPF